MDNNSNNYGTNDAEIFRNEIVRYLSFWPYLLILFIACITAAFLYLRYTTYTYKTTAVIEILDESQNSEMALPTELTVFNRSMINLENEINRLKSYDLNYEVVNEINANILFYKSGIVKTSQSAAETWYDDYKLDFKIDTDIIDNRSEYQINSDDGKLEISLYDGDKFINSTEFNSLSTLNSKHDLPFDLTVYSDKDLNSKRELVLTTIKQQANRFKRNLKIEVMGTDSDQLSLSLTLENEIIARNYLNQLIRSFDMDGISDRESEYRRTIEFVDRREVILKDDLNLIELKKQNYKQENNLFDITLDANNNIDLKSTYESEIFKFESQKQIAEYLSDLISESEYGYLPLNIGLENFDLNTMISEYNKIISERFRYLNESGSSNFLVKSMEPQLDNLIQNISVSLTNFSNSLDLKLKNLKLKETEFNDEYNRVPESEKTLRAIERELSIKEALYLLLLQKREEASINLAVVRPTVKVIDYAITDPLTKDPNSRIIYLFSIVFAFAIYVVFVFIWFFMDNKIHNKEQLANLLDNNIPIIAEIPFVKDVSAVNSHLNARSVISESIRMLISNLRFTSLDPDLNKKKSQTIVFTSSIKGEGKTLASVSTAVSLANDLKKDKKVILLGTDLRNPQIHKSFGVEKNIKGISEIIYNDNFSDYQNYINRFDNLDVIFSGEIPPNPTAMLSSKTFKNLIYKLKNDYDFIIIDSAPCLLVSDTFQYLDYIDSVVYLFRSNFTDSKIVNFINEVYYDKNIKNFNVVLNAVGNSKSYGYKYGYQYGYNYGYKYAYNYGYGYGYNEDKEK